MSLTQFGNALSLHAYLRKELIKAQELRSIFNELPLIRTDLFELVSTLVGNAKSISTLDGAASALSAFSNAFKEFILNESRYQVLANPEFINGSYIAKDTDFIDKYIAKIPNYPDTSSQLIRLVCATNPTIRDPTLEDILLAFTAPLSFRTLSQSLFKISPTNILPNNRTNGDPYEMRYKLTQDVTVGGSFAASGQNELYFIFDRTAAMGTTTELRYTFPRLLKGMYIRNPVIDIVTVVDGVVVKQAKVPANLNIDVEVAMSDDRIMKAGKCIYGIIRVGSELVLKFLDSLPAEPSRYVFKLSGEFLLSGCEIAQAAKQMETIENAHSTWNAALDCGIIPFLQNQPGGAGMNGCAGTMTAALDRAYENIYRTVANNVYPGFAAALPLNNHYYEHSRLVASVFGEMDFNPAITYIMRQKVCAHMVVVSLLLTSMFQYSIYPNGM